MKKSVIFLVVFLFSISFVHAGSGKITDGDLLQITEVSVVSNGERFRNIDFAGEVPRVEPGSDITVKVEVSNLESFVEIEDVEVFFIANDIGGASYEERTDRFTLGSNERDVVEFKFHVPTTTTQGRYRIELETRGRDESNRDHQEAIFFFYIAVDQTENEVRIVDTKVKPSRVECGERVVLDNKIANIGFTDKRIVLRTTSVPLRFSKQEEITLDSSSFTDWRVSFDIPTDVLSGTYRVVTEADYSFGNDIAITELRVECEEEEEEVSHMERVDEVFVNYVAPAQNTQSKTQDSDTDFFVPLLLILIVITLLIIIAALALL